MCFFIFKQKKGRKNMQQNETIKYLIENEVSMMLSMSIQTLMNWRFQGKGPAYTKAGRAVRYLYDDIVSFMEERKIIPKQ
jgi:hypothetical protein